MDKKGINFGQLFLGIIIIAFTLVSIVYLSIKIGYFILGLQKEILAAIIAGSSTIIVSVVSITIGKYYERKLIIEEELRQKKIPMYVEFVGFWFKLIMVEKIGRKITEKELIEYFNKFTQQLLIWGSDGVVKQWSELRGLTINASDASNFNNMFEFEKLLYEIRKDIGHKNKGLNKGDLLGLFINDLDKYIE